MIVLPRQQAIFVHVPKTGGDSISRFLLNNVPEARHSGGGKHWAPWMHEGHWRAWFKFGFVREPVSWYRSFYSFINDYYIVPHGTYPEFEKGLYHPMRRWEKYDFSSFNAMVESIYKKEPAYYTRLVDWMLGPPDSRMINFIGKQENLKEDFTTVLCRLGLNHLEPKWKKQMPRINISPSNFKADPWIVQLIQDFETSIYNRFNYRKK